MKKVSICNLSLHFIFKINRAREKVPKTSYLQSRKMNLILIIRYFSSFTEQHVMRARRFAFPNEIKKRTEFTENREAENGREFFLFLSSMRKRGIYMRSQ